MWFPRVPMPAAVLAWPAMKKFWFVRAIPDGSHDWVRNFPRLHEQGGKTSQPKGEASWNLYLKMYFRMITMMYMIIGLYGISLKSSRQFWYKNPLHFTYVDTTSSLFILSATPEAQRDAVSCPKLHSC